MPNTGKRLIIDYDKVQTDDMSDLHLFILPKFATNLFLSVFPRFYWDTVWDNPPADKDSLDATLACLERMLQMSCSIEEIGQKMDGIINALECICDKVGSLNEVSEVSRLSDDNYGDVSVGTGEPPDGMGATWELYSQNQCEVVTGIFNRTIAAIEDLSTYSLPIATQSWDVLAEILAWLVWLGGAGTAPALVIVELFKDWLDVADSIFIGFVDGLQDAREDIICAILSSETPEDARAAAFDVYSQTLSSQQSNFLYYLWYSDIMRAMFEGVYPSTGNPAPRVVDADCSFCGSSVPFEIMVGTLADYDPETGVYTVAAELVETGVNDVCGGVGWYVVGINFNGDSMHTVNTCNADNYGVVANLDIDTDVSDSANLDGAKTTYWAGTSNGDGTFTVVHNSNAKWLGGKNLHRIWFRFKVNTMLYFTVS